MSREGIEAQADYMHKHAAKLAKEGPIEMRDGRWRPAPGHPRYVEPQPRVCLRPTNPAIPRGRQIRDALWFGLRPSWMYEAEPHYDCGYWRHAAMNVALAWRWATHRETRDDREFAIESMYG